MRSTVPGPPISRIPIVIACGGRGQRIGGRKHTVELAGKPLLQRMADWAAAQTRHVALAGADPRQVEDADWPILVDERGDLGPIAALISAFEFARVQGCAHVMLVGCDLPFLPTDLLHRLKTDIGESGAAMPVSNGRDQPLAALWRCDPAALADYIEKGGRSVREFAHALNAITPEWNGDPHADPFANINDRETLAQAEERLAAQAR